MADEPRLNSLDRFRKQPGRLVLEQHSHCEVPAGCGGVVLRWRNPLSGRPFFLRLFTAGAAQCFLDGSPLENTLIDLRPGPHLLALALESVDLTRGFLAFAAVRGLEEEHQTAPEGLSEPPAKIVSVPDGSWKCSLVEPEGTQWQALHGDDAGWAVLAMAPPPAMDESNPAKWRLDSCTREGAHCLGLPAPRPRETPSSWWTRLFGQQPQPVTSASATPPGSKVWVRKRFEIPAPRLA